MRRLLFLVAVSAAISSGARAQDTRSDVVACRDSATTGLYRRCALWMEGTKVRRGEEGIVVARQGFLMPARLTHLVAGDSALKYARLFERRSKQSFWLAGAGTLALVGAFAIGGCGDRWWNDCTDHTQPAALGLLVAGGAATGLSLHFQVRATRAAGKAVWWNNERFAR